MYFVIILIYRWIWFAGIKLKCWQLYSAARYIWSSIVHPVSFWYQGYSGIPWRTRKLSNFFSDTEHFAYNLRILWLPKEFSQNTLEIAFFNLKFLMSIISVSLVQISTSGWWILLICFPRNIINFIDIFKIISIVLRICAYQHLRSICTLVVDSAIFPFLNCWWILYLRKIWLCQRQKKKIANVFL